MTRDGRVRLGIALVLGGLLAMGASIGIASRSGLKKWHAELTAPAVLPEAFLARFPDGLAVDGKQPVWHRAKLRTSEGEVDYLKGEAEGIAWSIFDNGGSVSMEESLNNFGSFEIKYQFPEFRLVAVSGPVRRDAIMEAVGAAWDAAQTSAEHPPTEQ